MSEKFLSRHMIITELGHFNMLITRKDTEGIVVLEMPSTCAINSSGTCGLECQFCQPDFRKSTVRFMCISSNESLSFCTRDEAFQEIERRYPSLKK